MSIKPQKISKKQQECLEYVKKHGKICRTRITGLEATVPYTKYLVFEWDGPFTSRTVYSLIKKGYLQPADAKTTPYGEYFTTCVLTT